MDWNAPVEMVEGVLTNPGDRTYTLVNVPSYLIGGQYVGSRTFPQGGFTWSISYNPPVSLFIWVMDIYLAGADNVLQGDGWSVEDAPGFQRSDGHSLSVWSKSFYDGTSVSVNGLNGVFVAGAVSVCPEALNLFSKAIWRTRALDGNDLVSAPKHHSFAEQDACITSLFDGVWRAHESLKQTVREPTMPANGSKTRDKGPETAKRATRESMREGGMEEGGGAGVV